METWLAPLICVLFVGAGAFLLLAPRPVAEALQRFYSRYPLTRLAPAGQLRSKTAYIRLLGATLVLVGLAVWML
ncbi:hypothetical protein [Phytopseudomonas dryadis]|uniref:Uncharacterized protein n=1 Tax=Phytopseudomonas dryadis TaxID=2487520 RepID=A0A4Q9R5X1_9GAMM|nr:MULTISPECIES: hypothetical protein [Pseudomonas]TBU94521.1 hypothetical protein DNK44_09420 [Pseudomonas dryadis]TBU99414.1 hypothetical protein DNK34_24575 [Pseudomonas dryadis]TBV12257.1 hypothetical protein DNK41_24715 [Pseudomonas sp. FRB 230]